MPPPGCQRSAAAAKTRSPTRVRGGIWQRSDFRSCRRAGGVPCSRLPRSRLIAVRAGQEAEGQTMVRRWHLRCHPGAPGVAKIHGRRLQCGLRDAPDTPQPPGPLRRGKRGRRWNVKERNTRPSRQCRLSFALLNLCVFVNLAASFVLQVLWPSKLLSGRMKLSGCPAVLAVVREGGPCFSKRCC